MVDVLEKIKFIETNNRTMKYSIEEVMKRDSS